MKQYKRILVATDLSNVNRPAAERAAILARQDKCELIVLHVLEHFPSEGSLSSVFDYNIDPKHYPSQSVRDQMVELVSALELPGTQSEIRITTKSARHEILRFAKAHEVDLIVVAPHGQGFIGALGSTAIGVLNGAKCDVLAVRDHEAIA